MRQILQLLSRFGFAAIIFCALLLPSVPTDVFAQSTPETWGDFINEPDISYGDLRSAQEHLSDNRIVMSIFSGMECEEKAYQIINGGTYGPCWYSSGEHKTTRGGHGYVPAGEDKAGFMMNFETLLFPTKHHDVLIEKSARENHAWLRKGDGLKATLVEDPAVQNPNFWVWNNPASLELRNEDGSPFYFHDNYLYAQSTFSNDGRWMLLFDTTGYLIRIDLETLSISTYRVADKDESLWPAIAISDSGRYITVNNRVNDFFVLDTQGCTETDVYIKIPSDEISCKTRSIKDYAVEYFEDLYRTWAEFWNDDILRVRGISKDGANGEEIIFRAPNTTKRRYVALGDSFSSGEGAGSYITGTNIQSTNMCHTSTKSYPYYINNRVNLDSFLSVACSGAQIDNVMSQTQYAHASDQSSFPGKQPQIRSITGADIVSITMSGNDIGFVEMLRYCLLLAANCYNSYEERLEIANQIRDVHPRLVTMYQSIIGTAPNKKKLYVIGYPQLVNGAPNATCAANVNFNYYQRRMVNDLINYFNAVIKNAAEAAGALYVGVEGAFNGYRLCDNPNHIKVVHGLTFGNEVPLPGFGPFSNASYHPTDTGQRILAQTILEKTDNFRERMPRGHINTSIPNPNNYPFLDVPSRGGLVHRVIYSPVLDNALVKRGVPTIIKVTSGFIVHGPVSVVRFVLMSDPVDLGETVTDELGSISAGVVIPESVPPGIHELRVNGFDTDGQPVSVRQFILVYAEEDDLDGNGIKTVNEICGDFIIPADEDLDENGQDDACNLPSNARPSGVSNPADRGTILGSTSIPFLNNVSSDVLGANHPTNAPALESNRTHLSDATNSSSSGSFVLWYLFACFLLLFVASFVIINYSSASRHLS